MSVILSILRLMSTRNMTGRVPYPKLIAVTWTESRRNFADKTKTDSTSNQIMVQGTQDDVRMRVRRARPADVPRVLRFVRENTRLAWPGLINKMPGSNKNIVLTDYIARTLAQGHTMLAEQQEPKRGWTQIRGLALSTAVCPWDATMLEKWARCVRCPRSKKLMLFTAHCLRAPGLHEKYRVHNILQVVLMVPQETSKTSEIVQMLVRNSIQRGKDSGYPVLRFDVTDEQVVKILDDLSLKREYELNYEVLPNAIKIFSSDSAGEKEDETSDKRVKSITVFTAFPHVET